MIKMNRQYIDVKGKVHNYTYSLSKMKKRSKCPNCNEYVNILTVRIYDKNIKIGYYCKFCNQVYIFNKYKVFIIKSE